MFRVETKDDFEPRQTCMLMQDTFDDDDDDDDDDQRNFLAPFNPVSRIKSHCHRRLPDVIAEEERMDDRTPLAFADFAILSVGICRGISIAHARVKVRRSSLSTDPPQHPRLYPRVPSPQDRVIRGR
ncbi:hypothetical protein ALC60_00648 [Trachymyrmex zeteki]|uniref:Uncharacterized protein n=1 Tax=Mycetomoellerius zeteki TaxID=64791 RepID=A0A151XJ44_9HYME|nr:hypothetical protein ALC60_00648 [Trachymyrmex zeteki]